MIASSQLLLLYAYKRRSSAVANSAVGSFFLHVAFLQPLPREERVYAFLCAENASKHRWLIGRWIGSFCVPKYTCSRVVQQSTTV